MKKSKLLIPALAIASVGCTVAPVIVSCGSKTAGTVTVAMTGSTTTGIYVSSTTSLYGFAANATVKYTGVKMGEGATSLWVATVSGSSTTAPFISVATAKINNQSCTVTDGTTYSIITLPTGLTAGSELTIEITYKTAASNCATTMTVTAL